MITIIAILITWYATKVYYTKNIKIVLDTLDDGLMRVSCSKCARVNVINNEQMRTPYYCLSCK